MSVSFYRGENPLKADKLNQAFSERVSRGGDQMVGPLLLWRNPQITMEAATKQYVDAATGIGAGGIAGVASFNTRTGAVTLTNADVTTAIGYTPYNVTNPAGYITSADLTPYAPLASPVFTGNPQAPTPPPGDSDTSVATTAYVQAAVAAGSGSGGSFPDAPSDGITYGRQMTAWNQVIAAHNDVVDGGNF